MQNLNCGFIQTYISPFSDSLIQLRSVSMNIYIVIWTQKKRNSKEKKTGNHSQRLKSQQNIKNSCNKILKYCLVYINRGTRKCYRCSGNFELFMVWLEGFNKWCYDAHTRFTVSHLNMYNVCKYHGLECFA